VASSQIKHKIIKLNNFLSRKSNDSNRKNIDFFDKLKSILESDEIMENEMMNKHTTFQLGGPAKFYIIPRSINKIIKVLQLCKEYSIEYFILGNGSNLLVSDHGYDGLIINIHENNFSNLKVEEIDNTQNKVIVGGGILMRTLAKKNVFTIIIRFGGYY
jgi:UDP-N-acetylmuramate dehydrogenase